MMYSCEKVNGVCISGFDSYDETSVNPFDTNLFSDAYVTGGAKFSTPLSKSIFPKEKHVLSSSCEFWHKLSLILMHNTGFSVIFDKL